MIETFIFKRAFRVLRRSRRPGTTGRSSSCNYVGRLGTSFVWVRFQIYDAGPQPWPVPSVVSGELPAFGSNFSNLKHHLSRRRRWLFWMRSLSIESVGLNLDLGDVNAEFLERRNC